jgi:hypothetical protein
MEDLDKCYVVTGGNLSTIRAVKTRLNEGRKLDYDQRRALAVLLETILDIAVMNEYSPNSE